METTNSQPTQLQSASIAGTLWSRSRTLLIVSALFGLGALNVLTLVNDGIHTAGYNVIKAILPSRFADVTSLLGNSPTAKRQKDAMAATKTLADEKAKFAEEIAKHTELKRISAKRAVLVQDVSKRVATRSIRNAVKNVASIPAEAIPYVGVAFVLSVTASDLYDDCQNLKDINELNREFGRELQDENQVCGMKVPGL